MEVEAYPDTPPTEEQASEVEAHIRREEAAGHVDVRFHRLPAVDPPTDHQGPVEFISRVVQLRVVRRRGRVRDALRLELGPREPVHGVPMAPWPLYAEQHLNDVGAAVAMEVDWRDNFVEARAVRVLMGGGEEGRKAREKAAEMSAACRKAVEAGGSSAAMLKRLYYEINNRCAAVRRSS